MSDQKTRLRTQSVQEVEQPEPTIYLAGPVQHADDGGHSWRTELQNSDLPVQWLNPLDNYDLSMENVEWVANEHLIPDQPDDDIEYVTPDEIVTGDKLMIGRADGLLINYPELTKAWGTPMEMQFAFSYDMPISVSHGDFRPSPWLIYHSDFRSMQVRDAAEWLIHRCWGERDP